MQISSAATQTAEAYTSAFAVWSSSLRTCSKCFALSNCDSASRSSSLATFSASRAMLASVRSDAIETLQFS